MEAHGGIPLGWVDGLEGKRGGVGGGGGCLLCTQGWPGSQCGIYASH